MRAMRGCITDSVGAEGFPRAGCALLIPKESRRSRLPSPRPGFLVLRHPSPTIQALSCVSSVVRYSELSTFAIRPADGRTQRLTTRGERDARFRTTLEVTFRASSRKEFHGFRTQRFA